MTSVCRRKRPTVFGTVESGRLDIDKIAISNSRQQKSTKEQNAHITTQNTHSCLTEALLLVAPGGVGQVSGVLALDGDVVLEGDVADLDVVEGPK